MFGQWMGDNRIDINCANIRIIGFSRSNKGRTSNIYMIRECDNCHAILEFPSNEVILGIKNNNHIEYIHCPNCENKVMVVGG